jgi:hypothetical protein
MDIRCPRCSEPWDLDELHYVYRGDDKIPFDEARQLFYKIGCAAMDGDTLPSCNERVDLRTEATAVIYDLLGDDIDGAAALLDDFEYAGLLDE